MEQYKWNFETTYFKTLWHGKFYVVAFALCLSTGIVGFGNTAVGADLNESGHDKRMQLSLFTSSGFNGFWPLVQSFSTAVAEDLNIELTIYQFADHIAMMELVHRALNDTAHLPDELGTLLNQAANVPIYMTTDKL